MKRQNRELILIVGLFMMSLAFSASGKGVFANNLETEVLPAEDIVGQSLTQITDWNVLRDNDYIYFSYSGVSANEWDKSYLNGNAIGLSYPNLGGYQGANSAIQFTYTGEIKDAYYSDIPGASITVEDTSSGTEAGIFQVSCVIPVSFLADANYTISFCGGSVNVADIVNLAGEEPTNAEQPTTEEQPTTGEEPTTGEQPTTGEEPTTGEQPTTGEEPTTGEQPTTSEIPSYQGIVIDGSFSDWDAVAKSPAEGNLQAFAAVYDEDAYIFVEDSGSMSATGAGPYGNGKYSITSDLGYSVIFQLTRDNGGSVSGIDGATCAYNDNRWEIMIPKSRLPKNNGTISAGLYGVEPFTTVTNLQGSGNIGDVTFTGIVYDGLFGDWVAYPHTLIQYATAGTQEANVDGEGALYAEGSTLYGHVVSSMSAHLLEGGGEFTKSVTIRFNQDEGSVIYPRCVTVDAAGNINWNPQTQNLSEGMYEFYLMDMQGWGNSTNINNLSAGDHYFGKMMVQVGPVIDEMEFMMDLEQVADKLGVAATDLHTIQAQFGRVGNEWIETAGASTGIWLGLMLCLTTVGVVWKKRRPVKEV